MWRCPAYREPDGSGWRCAARCTDRRIGERPRLAEKTIRNCVSGPLAKLGMRRRVQAAAQVTRMGAEKN
jgi:DNA-binding NarL/FixJ family response regulator